MLVDGVKHVRERAESGINPRLYSSDLFRFERNGREAVHILEFDKRARGWLVERLELFLHH